VEVVLVHDWEVLEAHEHQYLMTSRVVSLPQREYICRAMVERPVWDGSGLKVSTAPQGLHIIVHNTIDEATY
jgi:hypothetical protein